MGNMLSMKRCENIAVDVVISLGTALINTGIVSAIMSIASCANLTISCGIFAGCFVMMMLVLLFLQGSSLHRYDD